MKRRRRTARSVKDDEDENKGKRRRKSKVVEFEYNLVDRISVLPYEILVSMVSFLPIKEAVATSALSRRWRHVWKSSMSLNFQAVNFEGGSNYSYFTNQCKHWQGLQSINYADWVNHIVKQHRGQYIERFRVCFFLNRYFSSSIDEWIRFAMERRVQILELELLETHKDNVYTFPHTLLGLEKRFSKEELYSGIPSLPLPSAECSIGIKFLKVLRLQNICVTAQVLNYFLSNCPVLEQLAVRRAPKLVNLRVVGPSIVLKHLLIHNCVDLKSIEIRDANIVSFTYRGLDMIDLHLSNVPLLVEVSISKPTFHRHSLSLAFTQLSCCLSQIEILTLDIKGAVYIQNHLFPTLANVKYLELTSSPEHDWDIHHLICFMKATPYLQRLSLKLAQIFKLRTPREIEMRDKADCPSHHHLKVVEIAGYLGNTWSVEHVLHLIKKAVSLEKIVIDPRNLCFLPGRDRDVKEINEEREARDHAMQHLKGIVPSTIEFVCL